MKITFLGTGPAKPVIKKKEKRTNSSVIIDGILIDCTTNFLEQIKKENIKPEEIYGLLLTHAHKDAIGGLGDLDKWINHQILVFVPKGVNANRFIKEFKNLNLFPVNENTEYDFNKSVISPFKVIHYEYHPTLGKKFPTYGYRINDLVYAEDMESIPESSEKYFKNAKVIIADAAMWFGRQIRGHMNTSQSLDFAKKFNPETYILIQAGRTYPDQSKAEKEIKKYAEQIGIDFDIILAYDGMKFETNNLELLFEAKDFGFLPEEEIELQAFGSSGGKTKVASKIVDLIPEHKIYLEPFAGGAAVFWKKDLVEVNVLNDKNSEIAFAYKFIRDCTEEQLNRLKQMDWNPNKINFFRLRDSEPPKDPVQRFYRFYYVHAYSYGLSSKTYGYKTHEVGIFNRIPKLQEKLKKTEIYNTDYSNILEKYNSEDSFAYLDPPYPKEWAGPEGTNIFSKEDTQKLYDILKKFKGKFLLSINNIDWIRKIFSDFNISKIKVPRSFRKGDPPKYELLISNYDIKSIINSINKLSEGVTISDISSGGSFTGYSLLPSRYGKKLKVPKTKDENKIEIEEIKIKKTQIIELIKDVNEYDPSKPNNEQLADDWRIVNAWYATYKKTDGKGIKFSLETIINLAKLIYNEITKRVKEEKMKHEFNPNKMTENSRELYNIVISKKLSEVTKKIGELDSLIKQFKPIMVIHNFISLVGSQVKSEEGHTPNDIDLHIRMSSNIKDYLERAIKVRLNKILDPQVANKLHIFSGDAEGSHDTFIPVYHLALIPAGKEIIEMSKSKIELLKPMEPQKPAGSAYYDLNKFLEVLI